MACCPSPVTGQGTAQSPWLVNIGPNQTDSINIEVSGFARGTASPSGSSGETVGVVRVNSTEVFRSAFSGSFSFLSESGDTVHFSTEGNDQSNGFGFSLFVEGPTPTPTETPTPTPTETPTPTPTPEINHLNSISGENLISIEGETLIYI